MTTTSLKLKPLTSTVGAVVEGVDLSQPLSPGLQDALHEAILDRGVLFFRGQEALSLDGLAAFVANFGPLQPEPFLGNDAPISTAAKEFSTTGVKQGTAYWHADFTFFREPHVYTGLRSVKLPPVGGDTCWASMYAAYEALSAPLRRALDGLTAIHSTQTTTAAMNRAEDPYAMAREAYGDDTAHPVVVVHPETGRKALYVCEANTTRIVELSPVESRHLLSMLFEHIRSPLFAVRWTWTPHDVCIWDNRSVQHFATPDYEGERVMQNVRTRGWRPEGVSVAA
jgi:taurine dioxygenase